jgi:two-component system, NtrC family, response regulator AtoC
MASVSVLIVEDEQMIRDILRRRLTREGMDVAEAATGARAIELLEERNFDVALLDYRLPDTDGIAILRELKSRCPATVAIVVTAFTTVKTAIEALRLGASDFVTKPFSADEIVVCIRRALENQQLREEVTRIRSDEGRQFPFEALIGESPVMRQLKQLIRSIAESQASTVLLQGPSGTGKDFVAKIIHYNSLRAHRPFVNITCTAIAENLLESELFGHERGAFTDAREQKKGLFEIADGGTIFLDEIGDMPVRLQAKLLRFLEERAFRRVGGTQDISVDVRVVSATNQDIRERVTQGLFRADLLYRLNSLPVMIPPLKDRTGDVPLLVTHFIENFNRAMHKAVKGISPEALDRTAAYDWPGNVRELRNVVERAMLLGTGDMITAADLSLEAVPVSIAPGTSQEPEKLLGPEGVDLGELERQLVAEAIRRTKGNQTQAARLLRLSRDQLRYRLEKFGLLHRGKRSVDKGN